MRNLQASTSPAGTTDCLGQRIVGGMGIWVLLTILVVIRMDDSSFSIVIVTANQETCRVLESNPERFVDAYV
jgi:hypothetical protein